MLQLAGADLGALQVLEDAESASFALGSTAKALNVMGVFFVSAVREIQAGDVHAEAEEVAHGSFGIAGRADGADDLGAAESGVWGRALLRFVEVRFQLVPSTAGWGYGVAGVGAQELIVREQ